METSVEIRKFSEADSIEELTSLLHRAYKPLADQGMKFVASYQSVENTMNQLKKGECFVSEKKGIIIGTIFYYTKKPKDSPPFYLKESVGLFGKFAVEPDLQKMGIGAQLLEYVENFARSQGMKEFALDTSENAIELIKYYKKHGYKFVHYWQWDVTNYRSVIMAKTL